MHPGAFTASGCETTGRFANTRSPKGCPSSARNRTVPSATLSSLRSRDRSATSDSKFASVSTPQMVSRMPGQSKYCGGSRASLRCRTVTREPEATSNTDSARSRLSGDKPKSSQNRVHNSRSSTPNTISARPTIAMSIRSRQVRSNILAQGQLRFRHQGLQGRRIGVSLLHCADSHRILHHHPASLPAALLESFERTLDVVLALEFLAQHQRIFDRDTGAGGEVRRGRMAGIAEQYRPPTMPGPRQKYRFERPGDDR